MGTTSQEEADDGAYAKGNANGFVWVCLDGFMGGFYAREGLIADIFREFLALINEGADFINGFYGMFIHIFWICG